MAPLLLGTYVVLDGAGRVIRREVRAGAAPVVVPRCVRLGHGLQVDVGSHSQGLHQT